MAATRRFYPAMFLIALSTLVLQVLLMRLLSVVTWYHLAFFAISMAMLGMTAGAVTVFLQPARYAGAALAGSLAWACIGFALAVPFMLYVVCTMPLDIATSAGIWASSLLSTLSCLAPFYFSGIAVTATLTRSGLPVNRIYAADLIGAALGCAAVLVALDWADVPSLILGTSALGLAAGALFAGRAERRAQALCVAGAVVFAGLAAHNAVSDNPWRPVVVKGTMEPSDPVYLREWNSFSRVLVQMPKAMPPSYWGPSPVAPREPIVQMPMDIDGDAGTTVRPFRSRADIEHLGFDVTNMAYRLGRKGQACVIGVGGGRDVQAAILFGHEKVLGVELNPIFVDLLQGRLADFAGIGRREGVTLVADEARSYLARHPLSCTVLQMSLIDTWAATGAGAFSLSENGLYTVEGWRVFLSKLAPDGLFTVSRWYNRDNLGETGRLVSLAVASLLDAGVPDPAAHLGMVTSARISTLIVSKSPLSPDDVTTLREWAGRLQFEVALAPDQAPLHPTLARLVAARSAGELAAVNKGSRFNFAPPRDESPYFFNLLKLRHLPDAFGLYTGADNTFLDSGQGVARGNMVASAVLVALIGCLALCAVLTVFLPLRLAKRRGIVRKGDALVSGALYFAAIGAGFMFAEIGLIQRLSVFLGHPVYGLGVLLFSLIAATGVGSYLSGRIDASRMRDLIAFPVLLGVLLVMYPWIADAVMHAMAAAPMGARIAASLAMTVPLGLVMGCFYPTGMRVAERLGKAETPWYWALNGVMGTLVSGVAVFVSLYFSITANFWLGAACYVAALFCLLAMARRPAPAREATAPANEEARPLQTALAKVGEG